MPPVEFIRKMRIARITTATITVTPTRNCDHRNCCWLGKSFLRDRRRLQAQQRLFGIWGSRATHDSRGSYSLLAFRFWLLAREGGRPARSYELVASGFQRAVSARAAA